MTGQDQKGPQCWEDRHGGFHVVSLDYYVAERIRAETGVDLVAAVEDPERLEQVLERLSDGRTLVGCLAAIENTDEPAEFGRLFDADTIERAGRAFMFALSAFIPASLRSALRRLVEEASADTDRRAKTLESELAAVLDSTSGGSE